MEGPSYERGPQKNTKTCKSRAEVPGYTKSEVKVTLKKGFPSLDIYYMFERNSNEDYFCIEAENEEFGKKTLQVFPDENIDTSTVSAEVKNGILYLNWRALENLKPVNIPVN